VARWNLKGRGERGYKGKEKEIIMTAHEEDKKMTIDLSMTKDKQRQEGEQTISFINYCPQGYYYLLDLFERSSAQSPASFESYSLMEQLTASGQVINIRA
jgi:hypothetical protein